MAGEKELTTPERGGGGGEGIQLCTGQTDTLNDNVNTNNAISECSDIDGPVSE